MSTKKFKVLSEAPATTIVSTSMIDRRMDAGCFQPMYLENEDSLLNGDFSTVKLGTLYNKGNYGSLPDSVNYSTDGVTLIRGTDLQSMAVNLSDAIRVPDYYYNQFKKAQVKAGDILMLVKGASIDRPDSVAMLPKTEDKAIANGSIFIIRVNEKRVNSKYLLAVMTSKQFLLQKRRGSSNTGALYNDLDTIKSFIIPLPDPEIQNYIGRRVELAEKCRHASTRLQSSLDALLMELYQNVPSIDVPNKQTIVMTEEFDNDRMDAWHYQRHYIDLNKWIRRNNEFEQVSEIASLSKDRWNPKKETNPKFIYIEISNVDTSTGALSPNIVEVSNAPSRARKLLSSYDVLISTVRPNRGAISIVPKELNGAVASTGFAVLRTKNKEDAYFLGQIFKHPVSTAQLMRWNTGSTYPAIEEDVVLKIWAPGANENLRKKIGELEMKRYWLQEKSSKLANEAKSDVEALIEGKLNTEAILSGQLKVPTWEDIEKELEGI